NRTTTTSVATGFIVPGTLYLVTGGGTGAYVTYAGVQVNSGSQFVGLPNVTTYSSFNTPTVSRYSKQTFTDNVANGTLEYNRPYIVTSGSITYNGTHTANQTNATFTGVNNGDSWTGAGTVANYDDLRHWGWIGGGLQNTISSNGVAGSIGGGYEN